MTDKIKAFRTHAPSVNIDYCESEAVGPGASVGMCEGCYADISSDAEDAKRAPAAAPAAIVDPCTCGDSRENHVDLSGACKVEWPFPLGFCKCSRFQSALQSAATEGGS